MSNCDRTADYHALGRLRTVPLTTLEVSKHRAGNNCPVSLRFITTERDGYYASATLIFRTMLSQSLYPLLRREPDEYIIVRFGSGR
jgi:hypothetical protein